MRLGLRLGLTLGFEVRLDVRLDVRLEVSPGVGLLGWRLGFWVRNGLDTGFLV